MYCVQPIMIQLKLIVCGQINFFDAAVEKEDEWVIEILSMDENATSVVYHHNSPQMNPKGHNIHLSVIQI